MILVLININKNKMEGYTEEVEKIVDLLSTYDVEEGLVKRIGEQLDSRGICSVNNENTIYTTDYDMTLNLQERRELALNDYKLKINSGENFYSKLKELEERVFKLYYGDNWESEYAKMLLEREKEHNIDVEKICKVANNKSDINSSFDISGEELSQVSLFKESIEILKHLEYLEEFTINNYNTYDKDKINERKIYYRNIEEKKIENVNMWMNYIYYSLLIALILIMFNDGKLLNIKNIFNIILLTLLPVLIYPIFYKIFKYLSLYLQNYKIYPINIY